MASKKLPWDTLTIAEAAEALQLSAEEVMRCIAEQKLVPCKYFHGDFECCTEEMPFPDGTSMLNRLYRDHVSGRYYLIRPRQTGPFTCEWNAFSVHRTCDGGEEFFLHSEALVSDQIAAKLVFLPEEIERFKQTWLGMDLPPAASPESSPGRGKGITKRRVIQAFAGCYFNERQWSRALADVPDWLKPCRTWHGTKSTKHPTLWNPALIAIVLNKPPRSVPIRRLDRVFKDHAFLAPWQDQWENATADGRAVPL